MAKTTFGSRRVLGLLACLGAAAMLAVGCGDDDEETDAEATATTATGETNAAADEDSGACNPDEDPVKVGLILSLTGVASTSGTQSEVGAEFAIEDLNAQGGILGRCLEAVVRDDASDPTQAGQVARELVDQEEVDFVVGPSISSATPATLPIVSAAEKIQVLLGAAPPIDTAQTPHAYRGEILGTESGANTASALADLGYTTIGIVGDNSPTGQAQAEAFAAAASELGMSTQTELQAPDTVDWGPAIRSIADRDIDAIYSTATLAPPLVAIIRAKLQQDVDVPLYASATVTFNAVTDNFSDEEMADVFAVGTYRNLGREPGGTEPIGEQAVEVYERLRAFLGIQTFDSNQQQAMSMYDSINLVVTAANEAGEFDVEAIREWLESNPYDGVKAEMRFASDDHDGIEGDVLAIAQARSFENGTLELVE